MTHLRWGSDGSPSSSAGVIWTGGVDTGRHAHRQDCENAGGRYRQGPDGGPDQPCDSPGYVSGKTLISTEKSTLSKINPQKFCAWWADIRMFQFTERE